MRTTLTLDDELAQSCGWMPAIAPLRLNQVEVHSNDRDFSRFPGLRWNNPVAVRRVVLGSALFTRVNGAEVLQALGLAVEPCSAGDADTAALLWPQTRNLDLSQADRACLSLPLRIQLLG
ncbi:hypothetical protein H6G65_01730 [Microcystis elabens FACHB-917]|nr:hypothetical protein [Microcystis elabens FACHB-917]